jgi:exodeoxyribonuclease VII small subunit
MAKSSGEKITLEALQKGEVKDEVLATLSFEQALKLLEEVVTAVESGTLPLDQSIGSYEKGTVLVQHLRSLLSGAEEKLRILGKSE